MSLNPARPQRIGNFRDLVVWQEKVGDNWFDRETEPARVEPLKGREQYDADASQRFATANYKVFTRYRRAPNTADWRLLWVTGHQIQDEESPPSSVAERLIMDIESVANIDERRRYLEMVVTNTDTASFPPVPEPDEDGVLVNPGGPFTSTNGWIGYSADLSIAFTDPDSLSISTDLSGESVAVAELATTISETYRLTLDVNSMSPASGTIGASNNSDGSSLFEVSDPVTAGNSDSVDFTATATTTYVVISVAAAFSSCYVSSVSSVRL